MITAAINMARRSSARLRARNFATPQVQLPRCILSQAQLIRIQPSKTTDLLQDGRLRTPKTAPQLASVAEMDDMPGAFPQSASPPDNHPSKLAKHIAAAVAGETRTPKHKSLRPSDEEMHPHRFQASTTKPLEEARWLGFSEMAPHTEPPKGVDKWAPTAGTPTKARIVSQPSAFEFTFRAQSLELSNEARMLMAEKREEAARIKEEMARTDETNKTALDAHGRKIAHPKGKSGRFSEVHTAQFKKMDSIANHPSAARPLSREKTQPATSLKRTGSKAGLHDKTDGETKAKTGQTPKGAVPRRPSPEEGGSPAKRVRLESPKMKASVIKITTPSVAQQHNTAPVSASPSKIAYPSLPTNELASQANSGTPSPKKSTLIPSIRTPKSSLKASSLKPLAAGSSLYARSPTKFAHMSAKKEGPRPDPGTPLLAMSPSRPVFGSPSRSDLQMAGDDEDRSPMMSRSPARKLPSEEGGSKTPLLSTLR